MLLYTETICFMFYYIGKKKKIISPVKLQPHTIAQAKVVCAHKDTMLSTLSMHNFQQVPSGHQELSFFLQFRQKQATCSLGSRDPITALNSLSVTMLTHN